MEEKLEEYEKMPDIKIGDEIYVYKNKLFLETEDNIGNILDLDESMFGVITDIKQWDNTDYVYDYCCYKVTIKLNNGKEVKIKDKFSSQLFRRYEFITLDELNKKLRDINKKALNGFNILNELSTQ